MRNIFAFYLIVSSMTPSAAGAEQVAGTLESPGAKISARSIPAAFVPPALNDTAAACRKSELTQDKFLGMLRTIALHGDLTDIRFVEGTLGVKFRVDTGEWNAGHRTTYGVDSVAGAPISVRLAIIDIFNNPRQSYRAIGFENNSAFISRCAPISVAEFDGYFNGGFVRLPPVLMYHSGGSLTTYRKVIAHVPEVVVRRGGEAVWLAGSFG